MAIGIYARPKMTGEQYDEAIRKLEESGNGKPEGREYHVCFSEGEQLAVFDVWSSQEDFERFGEKMRPVLDEVGIDPGEPMIVPVRHIVTG